MQYLPVVEVQPVDAYVRRGLNTKANKVISDADFEAVRKMAAQGRRIPDVVMCALMRRMALAEFSDGEDEQQGGCP